LASIQQWSGARLEIAISSQVNVAIIGAGIVGLATGLELTSRFPGISLAVIDKESAVASHQSSHNSGVIHSGIYYKPGSLKAKLCVEGSQALLRFCQETQCLTIYAAK
jgi:L-2-hydroxyglutarate oxidase